VFSYYLIKRNCPFPFSSLAKCFLFHFSTVNSDGFKPNLETHLVPLLATKHEETTTNSDDKASSSTKVAHHPLLLQVPPRPPLCFSVVLFS
jgi:hypothetical protein